jgi:hypothetical protein
MGEYPSALDTDDSRWATGGGADKTEPESGTKDSGYLFEELVPYEQMNWHLNAIYNAIVHLHARPREFQYVSDGIDAVSTLDTYRVRQGVTSDFRFEGEAFSEIQGIYSGQIIVDGCADGKYCYYAQNNGSGSQTVRAVHPETGATAWTHTTTANDINCIACDGYRVYVGRDTGSGVEIEALDPADGTVEASAEHTANIVALAANGATLVAADASNYLRKYTVGASTLTYVSQYASSYTISRCAIDDKHAYIAQANASGDVHQILLSTMASVWQYSAQSYGVCCDGDIVYYSSTGVVGALGSHDGASIWSKSGLGTNLTDLFVDDHYLYCGRLDSSEDTLIFNKFNGGYAGSITGWTVTGVDPLGTFLTKTTGSYDYFKRNIVGYQTRTCQKCNVTDIKRTPYYAQAVPLSGK